MIISLKEERRVEECKLESSELEAGGERRISNEHAMTQKEAAYKNVRSSEI